MSGFAIQLRGVHAGYGTRPVLNGIDWEIEEGGMAALLELYSDAGFQPLPGETPDSLPLMLQFMAQAPAWARAVLCEKFAPVVHTVAENTVKHGSIYTPLLRAVARSMLVDATAPESALPKEEQA